MGRKRDVQLKFFCTEEEKFLIEEKMKLSGTSNFSEYARKILIDGYVIKRDFSDIKKLAFEIGKIGNNINQLAKIANSTGDISARNMREIQEEFLKLNSKISEQLIKKIRAEEAE